MPYGWTKLPSSPRPDRRNEVRGVVGQAKYRPAQLIGNQLFYDNGNCYGLLRLPPTRELEQELLDALSKPGQPAEILIRLTDADGN